MPGLELASNFQIAGFDQCFSKFGSSAQEVGASFVMGRPLGGGPFLKGFLFDLPFGGH